MAKNRVYAGITLSKPDGSFTESEEKRVLHFLETHFSEGKMETSKSFPRNVGDLRRRL